MNVIRDAKGRFLEHARKPLKERFLSKVFKSAQCWIWAGATNGEGYGFLKIEGHTVKASRLAYELFKEPIPAGKIVRHTCDVPACVNPDHLLIGTHKDNTRDMFNRGRNASTEELRNGQKIGARTKKIRCVLVTLPAVLLGIAILERNGIKPTFRKCWNVPGYNAVRNHWSHSFLVSASRRFYPLP